MPCHAPNRYARRRAAITAATTIRRVPGVRVSYNAALPSAKSLIAYSSGRYTFLSCFSANDGSGSLPAITVGCWYIGGAICCAPAPLRMRGQAACFWTYRCAALALGMARMWTRISSAYRKRFRAETASGGHSGSGYVNADMLPS